MFGPLGFPELLLIFVVILIVFGPRRIPEIGRTLGKALGEFKKATDDLKNTIEREVRLEELKQVVPTITPFESVSRSEPVLAAVTPAPVVEPVAGPPAESVEPVVESASADALSAEAAPAESAPPPDAAVQEPTA
jgi:TatA/E family protein of Tat protein translocase